MAKRKLNVVIGKYDPRGSKVSKMTGLKSYPFIMQYAKEESNGLDIQLRGRYINIYYKGGNLLKLSGMETCEFDKNYFYQPDKGSLRMTDIERLCHSNYVNKAKKSKYLKSKTHEELKSLRKEASDIMQELTSNNKQIINQLKASDTFESTAEVLEEMKKTMDDWKKRLADNDIRDSEVGERTVQHYISLQNKQFNDKTDFLVLDLEYAISTNASYAKEIEREKQPRIDILAIEKATGQVYVMELKYGMKSVDGEASAKKHYDDYLATVGNDSKWKSFIEDVKILLQAKKNLLIVDKEVNIADKKPIFAFIMKKEQEADEMDFAEHLVNNHLSHIKTIYLPVEKNYDNPSSDGHKLTKSYMK
jgi:hypothetical protein